MTIQSIESIYQDDGTIYVTAMVEDAVQTYGQTYYDPAEYGPALCEASFSVDDDEILPDNDYELIEYLEKLDLEWNPLDNSDDYFE
jgi:hypothetical protein